MHHQEGLYIIEAFLLVDKSLASLLYCHHVARRRAKQKELTRAAYIFLPFRHENDKTTSKFVQKTWQPQLLNWNFDIH